MHQQAPPPPPGVLIPKPVPPKYRKYSILAVAGIAILVAGFVISSATLLVSPDLADYSTIVNLLKFIGYTVSQFGAAILAISMIYCGIREEELDSHLRARMIVASLVFLILFPLITLFYIFPIRI